MNVYLEFILFAVLVIYFGYKLSQYGQVLSKRTIFSEALFGIIFLSIITSLPEVIASIGSVTLVNAPDMAASDAYGSILINLMIIAVLDIAQGKGGILSEANKSHIITAALTIALMGFAVLSLLFRHLTNLHIGLGSFGLDSLIIMLIYIVCVRLEYRHNQAEPVVSDDTVMTARLWVKFFIAGLIVVISGFFLAKTGEAIVIKSGFSYTFVGIVFLATATSLPELIVSFSALRLGSIDMAIGNILGSNLFDTAIVPICDIFYTDNQIFKIMSLEHVFTLSLCMVLSAIIITGLTYRSKKSFLKLGWDVIAMVAIFVFAMFVFYVLR